MKYVAYNMIILGSVLEQAVASSFSFSNPPNVSLNINSSKQRNKMRKVDGSRHGFSGDNPYGKRNADDKRQFVRH